MIWSWLGISVVTLAVAYSLAEICSAYPVAGGQLHIFFSYHALSVLILPHIIGC